MGAALGHLSLNEEDVLPHIDPVDDGLLPRIFADHILVEEGKGALVRRGSQSDQEGVKVIQNLLPHIVDRAVTLVDDDTVEKFRRIFLVVDHLFGRLAIRCGQFVKRSLLRRLVQLLPFQDGIHPLDGTDTHLHIVWQVRVLQPPHTVELGERSVVVIRPIGQKFPLRLLSQALGIHQEQHSVDLGIFQQTINCGDGGKRLACAGGHLNKRSGTVLTEGLLQIVDGRDLAIPEPGGVQGRKMLHVVAGGVILFQQFPQALWPMETEDAAGAVFLVFVIGKTSQLSRGFIGKPDAVVCLDPLEGTPGVPAGLRLSSGDIFSFFICLGLHNPDWDAIYKKRIIHRPGAGGKFPHRYAGSSHRIELPHILQNPTGLNESLINCLTRFLFRSHGGHPAFLE